MNLLQHAEVLRRNKCGDVLIYSYTQRSKIVFTHTEDPQICLNQLLENFSFAEIIQLITPSLKPNLNPHKITAAVPKNVLTLRVDFGMQQMQDPMFHDLIHPSMHPLLASTHSGHSGSHVLVYVPAVTGLEAGIHR